MSLEEDQLELVFDNLTHPLDGCLDANLAQALTRPSTRTQRRSHPGPLPLTGRWPTPSSSSPSALSAVQ